MSKKQTLMVSRTTVEHLATALNSALRHAQAQAVGSSELVRHGWVVERDSLARAKAELDSELARLANADTAEFDPHGVG